MGILAAAYLTGRLKIGIFASLASIGYWIYNANETVLIQMAAANAYALFTTMFVGLFMGFFLIYAWVSPSSR
ncbi:MAG: hypothetical protein GWO19_06815 [Nitrospinaceae bacterium]|nr:hypothetical protein [Nitrospinaceae bacterium]